jgi:hypothetical protein
MPSPFRLAGIIIVTCAVCGPATAQEVAPPGSGVDIHKLVIQGPLSHTVRYFVKGGSPRLQALVRRVEWAENELSVIEQLQLLKLDTVVNERRVAAFRTEQLTNPYSRFGFLPPPVATGIGGDCESPFQRALKGQMVYQATPDADLQLIEFLERLQTELDAELKALPPQEQKAAQGPIDALRPRVAALPRGAVAPPEPQPDVPGPTLGPPSVTQGQTGTTTPVAHQVRFPTQVITQQLPTPPDPVAFRQTVLQNQERVRQQILQTQQQIFQRHQEILQQHQRQIRGLRRSGGMAHRPHPVAFRTFDPRQKSHLFLDTKRLQQFNDFLVALAVKELLVGAGQSVAGALQLPFRPGAATNKNRNDPLLPMHDRGGQRRLPVVLLADFNVGSVVQKPLHPFRVVGVDATVKRRRDDMHGVDLIGIGRDDS